jgi:hypothetical protein
MSEVKDKIQGFIVETFYLATQKDWRMTLRFWKRELLIQPECLNWLVL